MQATTLTRSATAAAVALLGGLAPIASAQVINVEIDYMVAAGHSHMPQPAEIAAVVQMFACHGITLNVDVDDAIPETTVLTCTDSSFFSCTGAGTFAGLKATWFDHAGESWHYCIFGHQYNAGSGTTSSGIAELGGDDLLVTLGAFSGQTGTPFDRAATFAHELGHNLGLKHFGPLSSGAMGNFQPNYASVMSYQYQLAGVRAGMECLGLADASAHFKDLDYSSGRLPILTETSLVEKMGVGIHPVDWDCDGVIDSADVSQSLDQARPWCSDTSTPEGIQVDRNDWASLVDVFWGPLDSGGPAPEDAPAPQRRFNNIVRPTVTCMTLEERQAQLGLGLGLGVADPTACPGTQPTLTTEPCLSTEMYWLGLVGTAVNPFEPLGSGANPFLTFGDALAGVPAGGVIFVQPQTWSVGASPLDQPIVLAGPGGALLVP